MHPMILGNAGSTTSNAYHLHQEKIFDFGPQFSERTLVAKHFVFTTWKLHYIKCIPFTKLD
jgi:hypothetical protein